MHAYLVLFVTRIVANIRYTVENSREVYNQSLFVNDQQFVDSCMVVSFSRTKN